jgi:protein TonB
VTPARRLTAGLFVVFLHVLAIWGFTSGFLPKKSAPPPVIVNVSLLPQVVAPPRLPPPPLPRFATQTATIPLLPQIAIAPPPSRALPAAPPQMSPSGQPGPSTGAERRPSPPPDYLSRLLAHLNAYKNYPYDARLRHEQGTVRLHFRMDRTGHVLSYEVSGSSGSASLDEEARAMIRRAQPLPPPPADYPGDTLDLVVPLVFSLR